MQVYKRALNLTVSTLNLNKYSKDFSRERLEINRGSNCVVGETIG